MSLDQVFAKLNDDDMLDLYGVGIGLNHFVREEIKTRLQNPTEGRGKKSLTNIAREMAKHAKPKRVLSPAARKRIGDAQKKRWAEWKKNKKK